MATILVIDDQAPNRERLSKLLSAGGHRLLEAPDAHRGLELVRTQHPDLVLCGVLTPDAEGHEVLQRLRADASTAATPVVLYSLHAGGDDPGHERLEQLATHRLFDTVHALRRSVHRVHATFDLGFQLMSHRDPAALLDEMCRGACALIGASHGMAAVRDPDLFGETRRAFCGVAAEIATADGDAEGARSSLATVVAQRRPLRLSLSDADGSFDSGLPAGFPVTCALLAAPIMSPQTTFGWICLTDKPDRSAFSEEDEQLLCMLGRVAGQGCESGLHYQALKRLTAQQLKSMSWRLIEAQEAERRQLSRELHDHVGQSLTALGINLDILRTQGLVQGRADLQARLDDSIALLHDTVGAIENVMAELRPPMLDDHGLLAALQWHADQFTHRTGIATALAGDPISPRLGPPHEIALFRIAQEALNNVAKHARASRVDVELRRTPDGVELSIADDGAGFDPARLSPRAGRGMATMRERAESIGGRFELRTTPGVGTRVSARIGAPR